MTAPVRMLKRRLPLVHEHAQRNGWEILNSMSGGGHFRLVHGPTGRKTTVSMSASDHRTMKNTVAQMRRIERGLR